jgi:hypothetical protein
VACHGVEEGRLPPDTRPLTVAPSLTA